MCVCVCVFVTSCVKDALANPDNIPAPKVIR